MKRLAKLGNIEFTIVEDESIDESASITEHQVETGQNVSDHIKHEALRISIKGIMTGTDALEKFNKLKKLRNKGELMNYQGREHHKNIVILNIQRNYNKEISNGFYFDLSIVKPRISTAKKVTIKISSPTSKAHSSSIDRYASSKGYLSKGDRNNSVKNLQADLSKLGYNLVSDGIYGAATEGAVKKFQKKYKLKVDGIVGVETKAKLKSLMTNSTAQKKTATKVKPAANKGKQQPKTNKVAKKR